MNKLITAVTSAVCWAGLCVSASAFCVTDDAAKGCPMPFAGSNAAQPDGDTTRQGYDAQTGNQWSSASHKMGDFTFYSGNLMETPSMGRASVPRTRPPARIAPFTGNALRPLPLV